MLGYQVNHNRQTWSTLWFWIVASTALLGTGCASTPGEGGSRSSRGRGTPWTIRCLEAKGPNRISYLREVADTLKQTPGIRPDDVFIRDESDGYARLYYGTYYRQLNPRTGNHADSQPMRRDLELLRQLGTTDGRRYFMQALPVRMPQPDVGNPAWDLRNLDATYSLQVAVFEPTDTFIEYKQAAVEYCEYLRGEGHEAYFFHAPASSYVTVGAFGPDAVRTGADGLTYYSPQVRALQQNELFKYNVLNGAVYRVRGPGGVSAPVESRLVEVPRRE
jgi:hypothetical protein